MIDKVLAYYVSRLDEYLRRSFPRPEGMAEVGAVGDPDCEKPCKVVVSVLSVERETAGDIAAPVQRSGERYTRTYPPLQLNVNLMLAAVYDEKRYAESLIVFSSMLDFLQATPCFECGERSYTMEVRTYCCTSTMPGRRWAGSITRR